MSQHSTECDASKIVTNTSTQRWSRRRFLGGAVSVAALGSFAAACGGGADQPASTPALGAQVSPVRRTVASPKATSVATGVDAELIKQRYLGLKPFAPAPPPPAVKPITLSTSDPTVFSSVPMTRTRASPSRTSPSTCSRLLNVSSRVVCAGDSRRAFSGVARLA